MAKPGPERATDIRQYDLIRPNVGQKEPPRLGNTICYGQTLARKSHRDSVARFIAAKHGPERATETRQNDLLWPNMGQKDPPRLGNTICFGQELATKSHQDSATRFITAKRGPERIIKTRQHDLLRLNADQKESSRFGNTICYDQELVRKSLRDSAIRFVTAEHGPERAIETRQYDLIRPRIDHKEPSRLDKMIYYGQSWARKSHRDSAVRFVTPKCGPERAIETRQYDLLRPNMDQNEPPIFSSTICYGQTWARKSHQDSAGRFFPAKCGPERATETRQYDLLLRPRIDQKEPPRLGNKIYYGQAWARKNHQVSRVRFVNMAKPLPERPTETRQFNLLRPRIGQKEPRQYDLLLPNMENRRDSVVRFDTTKCGPERATETRQYDLLRPNVCQKKPPTANHGPEKATKTRQYDVFRPNVGQKEPLRFGSTICDGQTWARKSHRDSAVQLSRPNVGQKEPPRLCSTICYGREFARKSHRDSAVRFVSAKNWPDRATETRQYDLVRPNVGHKRATKIRQYDLSRPRAG